MHGSELVCRNPSVIKEWSTGVPVYRQLRTGKAMIRTIRKRMAVRVEHEGVVQGVAISALREDEHLDLAPRSPGHCRCASASRSASHSCDGTSSIASD